MATFLKQINEEDSELLPMDPTMAKIIKAVGRRSSILKKIDLSDLQVQNFLQNKIKSLQEPELIKQKE